MVWKTGLTQLSRSYYVRFYFRNDDTSGSGDHIVVANPVVGGVGYENLTLLRKYGGSSTYRLVISMFGCGDPLGWPWQHWGPGSDSGSDRLQNGQWYRFEFFVEFVSPTAIRVHPRIYNAAGALIYADGDFKQEAYGTSSRLLDGSNTWTLAKFYTAGKSFCVSPTPLTALSLGNNGQAQAIATGLTWSFAAVQVRDDTWPGPDGSAPPAQPNPPSSVLVQ